MNTQRRAALRLIGGFSAIAPIADTLGVKSRSVPAMSPESLGVAQTGNVELAPNAPCDVWRFWSDKQHKVEQERWRQERFQINGLDPDIQCLKSVSPVMKKRIQMVRDERSISVYEAIRKKLGTL